MIKGKKKLIVIILFVLCLVALSLWTCNYVLGTYHVNQVYVDGNIHYSEDEIKEMVMGGLLGENSLYLSYKYKNMELKNVPFLDAITIETLSPDTIKITVYEKALAGYIKYLDTYMYFDKDGYIVENSSVRTSGIPQITGLSISYAVLGQPLPVEDPQVFSDILTITKLLSKYELSADKIHLESDKIILYFGKLKVALGDERSRLENKIMNIPKFLPTLEGKEGTLHMETYDETNGKYIFKPAE